MPPRGLRTLLKNSRACKLVGSGFRKRFETCVKDGRGVALKGVTKRLESKIFSSGVMPFVARHSDSPAGGHWRGPGGGRRRGSAVDAQVSRLAGVGSATRKKSSMLRLTKIVFAALEERGLEPVLGQRGVCSVMHRLGTAADIVCHDADKNRVVFVELKCGHANGRKAAALKHGEECKMRGPLRGAKDTTLNRHLAQLAVTTALFMREKKTIQKLNEMGVDGVDAALIYANDSGAEIYRLPEWWKAKGTALVDALK